jgi:hypothetical protein
VVDTEDPGAGGDEGRIPMESKVITDLVVAKQGLADARDSHPSENAESSSWILHNSNFSTIRAGRSKYIEFSTQFWL